MSQILHIPKLATRKEMLAAGLGRAMRDSRAKHDCQRAHATYRRNGHKVCPRCLRDITTPPALVCSFCPRRFYNETTLTAHKAWHGRMACDQRNPRCPACRARLKKKKNGFYLCSLCDSLSKLTGSGMELID